MITRACHCGINTSSLTTTHAHLLNVLWSSGLREWHAPAGWPRLARWPTRWCWFRARGPAELRQLLELCRRRPVAVAVGVLDARLQQTHALAPQLQRRARQVPRHAHQVRRDHLRRRLGLDRILVHASMGCAWGKRLCVPSKDVTRNSLRGGGTPSTGGGQR